VPVASEPDECARRDYVRQTFVWFFDRVRLVLSVTVGIIAAVGFAIITSMVSGKLGHGWITAIALLVLGLLVLALVTLHRIIATPLRREYLCCLVLVRRLEEYEDELRRALRARPQPEPYLHGSLAGRTFSWDGRAVTDALQRAAERFTCDPAEPRAEAG
jgi:hypothetical protein